MKTLGTTNRNAVPKVTKVVLSMGVGEARQNKKLLEHAVRDLGLIAGQRPVVTKARVSVAGFHLRQGMEIGCKVTLRGKRMWEFLDRLVSVAIPRIRDFRGLNPKSFDGRGTYNLGLTEQLLFPEIAVDSVEHPQGLNVTIVTTAEHDDAARTLLAELGFPFRTS
jgi:large subunit ribosomal protein L5